MSTIVICYSAKYQSNYLIAPAFSRIYAYSDLNIGCNLSFKKHQGNLKC